MPRHGGFFDDRTPEQAYGEGYRERTESMGDIVSDFAKTTAEIPEGIAESITGEDPRSEQEKSYDAGWNDAEKDNSWW